MQVINITFPFVSPDPNIIPEYGHAQELPRNHFLVRLKLTFTVVLDFQLKLKLVSLSGS